MFDSEPFVELSVAYDELKRENEDLEKTVREKTEEVFIRVVDCQKYEDELGRLRMENADLKEKLKRKRSSRASSSSDGMYDEDE